MLENEFDRNTSGRPPENRPTPEELRNCRPYLERELELLTDLRVIVALGRIAMDTYLAVLRDLGEINSLSGYRFGHNVLHETVGNPGRPHLLCSYHPSQQNTSTGKLTAAMLRQVFEQARELAR